MVAYCTVKGELLPLQESILHTVKAAKEQGFDTLYVAQSDLDDVQQLASEGLAIKGLQHVKDLFRVNESGCWEGGT